MHLDMLSKKHLETKFAKIDAEKSPFLTERLKIWMLPTLALISKEKVLDYVVGFDDLGGTDDFPTEHLRLVSRPRTCSTTRARRRVGREEAQAKTTEAVEKKNLRKGGGRWSWTATTRTRTSGTTDSYVTRDESERAHSPPRARCGAARECIIYGKTPDGSSLATSRFKKKNLKTSLPSRRWLSRRAPTPPPPGTPPGPRPRTCARSACRPSPPARRRCT